MFTKYDKREVNYIAKLGSPPSDTSTLKKGEEALLTGPTVLQRELPNNLAKVHHGPPFTNSTQMTGEKSPKLAFSITPSVILGQWFLLLRTLFIYLTTPAPPAPSSPRVSTTVGGIILKWRPERGSGLPTSILPSPPPPTPQWAGSSSRGRGMHG